ncbi:olfactory receptor 6N1-like [Discoglossus pictus]
MAGLGNLDTKDIEVLVQASDESLASEDLQQLEQGIQEAQNSSDPDTESKQPKEIQHNSDSDSERCFCPKMFVGECLYELFENGTIYWFFSFVVWNVAIWESPRRKDLTTLNLIMNSMTKCACEAEPKNGKQKQHGEVIGEPFAYLDGCNLSTHSVKEFIIYGFPSLQGFPILLFCVFVTIYFFTVIGNGIIILLVLLDQHLHTPMYFLIINLSFIDLSYTSVTVPKMLAKFSMKYDTISYTGCFLQMYFFISFAAAECLFLPLMAYDRYIAICSPLHYHAIMTSRLCILLCVVAWTGGFAAPVTTVILALKLPFYGPNIIHHYYCDHPPLLQLACADTSFNVSVGSSLSATVLLSSFTLVVTSYVKIILSILKITSHEGRRKAFSTCASHFVVVNLFFLPLIFMYIRPSATYSSDVDSLVAMLYTVLTPMLNPIIYSMRNKDIKNSFRKKMLSK